MEADLRFLWASNVFVKKGRVVLGHAEEVLMRTGSWQKARMEQQMYEWFGRIPDFIITMSADDCAQCSALEFCALMGHADVQTVERHSDNEPRTVLRRAWRLDVKD